MRTLIITLRNLYQESLIRKSFSIAMSSIFLIFVAYISNGGEPVKHKVDEQIQETELKTSGKNGKHINQQAKEQAKKEYENAKQEFNKIDSKPQKTKDDKNLWDKLRKQVKHWRKKMNKTGENHSQKNKGN